MLLKEKYLNAALKHLKVETSLSIVYNYTCHKILILKSFDIPEQVGLKRRDRYKLVFRIINKHP